jgi:hypothetical protein
MEDFGESILSLWGCRETENVLWAQLEERLTEYFGTYMVGFIYDEGPNTFKVPKTILF